MKDSSDDVEEGMSEPITIDTSPLLECAAPKTCASAVNFFGLPRWARAPRPCKPPANTPRSFCVIRKCFGLDNAGLRKHGYAVTASC